MQSSGAQSNYWPMALRCASEIRFRRQLQGFGISTPMVLPFGIRAAARQKVWRKTDPWSNPNVPVRLWGPATDMSLTSQGYYAETSDGKFIRTTAFIVPKWQAPDEPLQAIQIPPPVSQNPSVPSNVDQQVLSQEPGLVESAHGEDEQLFASEEEQLFDPHREQESPELIAHLEVAIPDQSKSTSTETVSVGLEPSNPEKVKIPRRLHFKQTVVPALSRLTERAGGEEISVVSWERFADYVAKSFATTSFEQSWQDFEAWMLFQHRNLGVVLQDFVADIQGEESKEAEEFEMFKRVSQERRDLEAQLKSIQEQPQPPSEPPEVLQTRTVAMHELRENPHEWIAPFKEEYENLCKTVIEPLTPVQVKEAISRATHVERVPGKMVATVKPPGKKKGRIVACGNFTEASTSTDNSAGGVDSITIRSVLRLAADRKWQVTVCDIRRAFLNAPRLELPGHLTLVSPPPLLTTMQITKPGEIWRVKGALYGFCESPRDWGVHRDATCRNLSWHVGGDRMYLKEAEERHLWKVCRNSDDAVEGYLCIYVDDLMAVGPSSIVDSLMTRLQETWECSTPETVDLQGSVRYCGYELQRLPSGGIKLWQPSYTQELLNKHNVTSCEPYPCPKIENAEDEDFCLETLRAAQALTGELQWLQGRTRPDICYVIGCMSRWQHRRPSYVIRLGQHVLKYLNQTKDFSLWYEPSKEADWGENGVLQVPRSMSQLEIYVDSSFALEHEQSRSITGILIEWCGAPIQWFSSRQPFIAASTGESELLGYSEGHQQAESVGSLLTTLSIQPTYVIYGDSKSAIALATQESGPWRTRHLRIRAHRLREALRCDGPVRDNMTWTARHMDGSALVADGLTKALQHQLFHRFAVRLGLHGRLLNNDSLVDQSSAKIAKLHPLSRVSEWVAKLCEAARLMMNGSTVLRRCGQLLLMLSTFLVAWAKKKETSDHPRLCAFRPGHGEQLPIRPNRGPRESQANQRGQAVCRGVVGETSDQQNETHRADVAVPLWWDHAALQHLPGGKDRWMVLEDRWLVRVHGETRRRSFQPIHRSCPVQAERINSSRSTLLYPMSDPSYGNRQCRHDTWTSMDLWSKDFLWKGYTIFDLKTEDAPNLSSVGGASDSKPAVQSDKKSFGYPTSSTSSYGQTGLGSGSSGTGAPVFNVNINVNTTVTGGTTDSRVVSSAVSLPDPTQEIEQSGSSDFEFVSEDEK